MQEHARFNKTNLSKKALGVLSAFSGTHVSKRGYEFDFLSERWTISSDHILVFNNIVFANYDFELGFRAALCRYAEEYSPDHTRNMFRNTRTYLRDTGVESLTAKGIAAYKAGLPPEQEWWLGAARGFWLSWYDWDLPGIDDDAAKFLEELTLTGNEKGAAVKKGCPYTGPLTELEQAALLEWSTNALYDNIIELPVYAYFLSLFMTGRRPVQIRNLKAGDLSVCESDQGNNYELKIPRAKQRDGVFRGELKSLQITEELYISLKALIDDNNSRLAKIYGRGVPDSLRQELPLFIEFERISKRSNYQNIADEQRKRPDYYHVTRNTADDLMRTFGRLCEAKSERTGDYIILNARRFRYTKGTNLARHGIDGVTLAEALDHSDTQHIGVYTENVPRNAEIINEIMSSALAPLAQAFAGELIESERHARRAEDPHSRVKNGRADNVGNCGSYGFCASGYRSCYTCKMFQPWQDAPHHEVLADLLAERQRQLSEGVSPHVVQATDRLLLAVQQIVQLCEAAKMNQGSANG